MLMLDLFIRALHNHNLRVQRNGLEGGWQKYRPLHLVPHCNGLDTAYGRFHTPTGITPHRFPQTIKQMVEQRQLGGTRSRPNASRHLRISSCKCSHFARLLVRHRDGLSNAPNVTPVWLPTNPCCLGRSDYGHLSYISLSTQDS